MTKVYRMKFFFLHNHFIPPLVKNGPHQIESVIVPEFYPDLNCVYLNEPCYFTTLESYIEYVTKRGYYGSHTPFAIENNRIIDSRHIHEVLLAYKELGVKIIQLSCGRDNDFFRKRTGLTYAGEQLLHELYETDLLLDLSHLDGIVALNIASRYHGKIIISHCACSDLYSPQKSRSNSLTRNTICQLAERVEVFGLPFLNDIIASKEHELCSEQIFDDLIEQIIFFSHTVGTNKVALAPDYIDTAYFSRRFTTELVFPDILLSQDGLFALANRLNEILLPMDVDNILFGNVERLLRG